MSNQPDRFAIIPIHPGQTPPANNIMYGDIQPLTEFLRMDEVRTSALNAMSRADTAREELAEREADLHTRQLELLNVCLDNLAARMDAFEERLAARIKADEETEAEHIRQQIDALPDPDCPEGPMTYPPGGELHSIEPTGDADSDVLPARFSREAPIAAGPLEPASELSYPETPKYRAPAAVSLNSDDNDDEGDPTLGASTPPGHTGY